MAEQLSKDIEIMGIPVDFISSPYILPVSYGYSDGHYCAGERAERSNGWIVLFDSLDGNEFRWYILEHIANEWGVRCERNHEGELKMQPVTDVIMTGERHGGSMSWNTY